MYIASYLVHRHMVVEHVGYDFTIKLLQDPVSNPINAQRT